MEPRFGFSHRRIRRGGLIGLARAPRSIAAVGMALAVGLSAGLATAAAAQSAAPGASAGTPASAGPAGELTFMRADADGAWQIWTSCADLSNARQVTSMARHDSSDPVWSPDGSRIAYDGIAADPDITDASVISDVFTMDPDGSRVVNLTGATGLAGDPAWSPDGTLLAYEGDAGGAGPEGIFVMAASDGSGKRRITTLPAGGSWDGAPRFSPDGSRLVFTRTMADNSSALFIVGLDGSGLRRITTSDVAPGDATWSPDGSQIVFEADLVNGRGDAWLIRPDGGGLRNLTAGPNPADSWEGFADPVWSPAGDSILLLHGYHYQDGTVRAGLATIAPDGTGLRYVADGTGVEHQPDWSRQAGC